uniref:Uncharacterized protein n=1 Tax=Anguilla anguilla TaxID=7936 RepID=A0A0E9PKX8_ANGAN
MFRQVSDSLPFFTIAVKGYLCSEACGQEQWPFHVPYEYIYINIHYKTKITWTPLGLGLFYGLG